MSNFPSGFADQTQLLTTPQLDDGDAKLLAELTDRGYEIHTGLTLEFADAIAKMCQQPSIKEYCPNDAGVRFANQSATEKWLAKGRGAFLLLARQPAGLVLVGYGWAGDSTSSYVPAGRTTFATRIGEEGQGQGLGTPFTRLIVAAAAQLYGARDFWLETWGSNGGAMHIYHKIGFVDVDQTQGQRPTLDGGMVPDTRFYMSLDNKLLAVDT